MDKKIFMLADADPAVVIKVGDFIRSNFEDAVVYTAADGREALVKMRNVVPHIAIIDLDLPKVSGAEMIRHILTEAIFKNTLAVVFSDIPDRKEFVEGDTHGRIKYVEKPVEKGALLAVLNKALERAGAQKEQSFVLRFLAPGECLFKEGDKAESAFLIKKGRLKATKTRDGAEQILGEARPGEFVGEMAHINGEPRSADVYAIESCELIEVPLGTLDALLFSKPVWSTALMKTLAQRLKTSQS